MEVAKDFEGKVVWVTGGASGIGAGVCKLLGARGAQVVCTDLQDDKGQDTVRAIEGAGGKATFYHQDVTNEDAWKEINDKIQSKFGALHGLVNNAGIGNGKSILETTLEEFRHMFAINMESIFLGTRTVIPPIDASGGGAIVNISSVAGLRGAPNLSTYCATKGGVRLYTKATAVECARGGLKVRCNSIHPGIIDTPIWEAVMESGDPNELVQSLAAQLGSVEDTNMSVPQLIAATAVPGGQVGHPSDIANAVVFLLCDASQYINGTELVVDAGLTAST